MRRLFLAALLVPSFALADTRVPTIDDMVALKRVSQPAVSPDGSRVAYWFDKHLFGATSAK